jgi:hypothetical protein
MKILILSLLFAPFLANAADGPKCRFSKKAPEQNSIVMRGCGEPVCNHVVVCGKIAKSVTCKSKNGSCDGYTANDCVANQITEPAEFETKAPPKKVER